ncbi:MAG: DNA gyrase subunit A [Caldimicrobium sp.]|nr:DNA gyrase subunit A [Caldimicrobium sp.]MCX7613773.1 DNA gyrase subunit A [Caldimicrobium sp.]MDW8182600.1 DNA gyrase subunit A [Caldimicrobium sp.]
MGEVIIVPLEEELKESYLDYAMSVIVGRALPDVRDGLKPVQRRILYAMYETGNDWNKPFKKSARIVGEVIGKFHPHGDVPVYESIVRMSQDFTMRYPLIDGQGNFGSIDGDAPAAMRYTEVRLTRIAHELLTDIDKETVEFVPNYDNTLREPVVLPSKVPNLLVNGSAGIAVGMATNIPPHNLGEVVDALIALLRSPDLRTEDLLNYIKGPDFPTGALIVGREGIIKAYETGKGIIKLRAKYRVEKEKEKIKLVFTEIPYQVNKAKVVERIAELIRDKKLEGIAEIRDESDREGIRVVVELKREWAQAPHTIAKKLFELTPLETTFGIIFLALVQGRPELLTLRDILQHFLNWRRTVVIRRTQHDLRKAKERAHILEGFLKALEHIDEIIELIKSSDTPKTAKEGLMGKFNFTEIQAQEILNLRLQRLTALEREKILLEFEELQRAIAYYEKILTHEPTLLTVIEQELKELREKFGDSRRTVILEKDEEVVEEERPHEEVLCVISEEGYLRKISLDQFVSQRRGGKGVALFTGEERLRVALQTETQETLLLLTKEGKAYPLELKHVPLSGRQTKGTHLRNFLSSLEGEVVALLPYGGRGFLVLITKQGIIKKIPLEDLSGIRRSGITVLNLKSGDSLLTGVLTSGTDHLLILSREGQALHFSEEDVRPMGRQAEGVIGIRLDEGDEVVSLLKSSEGDFLFTVTDKGFGKKTKVSDYRVQGRGGKGITAHGLSDKTGKVMGGLILKGGEELLLIASSGKVIRLGEDQIPVSGRNAKGVRLMSLLPGEMLSGLIRLDLKAKEG